MTASRALHDRARGYVGIRLLRIALSLTLLLAPASLLHAQGCSECREQVGQAPMRTQIAYRRAIVLMVVAGGGVFAAGVVAMRRFR